MQRAMSYQIMLSASVSPPFHSFQPSLSSRDLSPSFPRAGRRGGGVYGGVGCAVEGGLPEFFSTDEPEAATNLPLRTSAKSPQESCA